MQTNLHNLGYTQNIFPFTPSQLATLKDIATQAQTLELTDRKNIFQNFPIVKELFDEAVKKLGLELTDYCFYIEKNSDKNWNLLYHRDINFPDYLVVDGMNKEEILEHGVMFRLTLDSSDTKSGAIKVLPNSHREESAEKEVFVETQEGEVILFKPLLLHGSNKMQKPQKRRVFQALCIIK